MLKKIVTRDDVAELLVMSDRNVSRLTKMGVLKKGKGGYVLGEVVPQFVEHLRDQIADADPNEALYRAARARKMEALATSEEMRVKLQNGELLERARIIFVVGGVLTATKNHMLSLASRIARQLLPHVADETKNANFKSIHEIVSSEVHACLREASEFEMSDITAAAKSKRNRERA